MRRSSCFPFPTDLEGVPPVYPSAIPSGSRTDPNHSYSDHHLEEEAIIKFVGEKGTPKVMHPSRLFISILIHSVCSVCCEL